MMRKTVIKLLVVGMNPSNTQKLVKPKNSTFDRLHKWFAFAGVERFSFVNTTQKLGEVTPKDVDYDTLKTCINGYRNVFALGGFASDALKRIGVDHYVLPHPSPRNRSFNDPTYEPKVMSELKTLVETFDD